MSSNVRALLAYLQYLPAFAICSTVRLMFVDGASNVGGGTDGPSYGLKLPGCFGCGSTGGLGRMSAAKAYTIGYKGIVQVYLAMAMAHGSTQKVDVEQNRMTVRLVEQLPGSRPTMVWALVPLCQDWVRPPHLSCHRYCRQLPHRHPPCADLW